MLCFHSKVHVCDSENPHFSKFTKQLFQFVLANICLSVVCAYVSICAAQCENNKTC